ncbi:hypothetical protein [Mycolicibacterium sp. CBMA 226]|uniref:hypothetical protein n=1 Tax=Mycolicibacterium sp. CBMA 226 TaxID=2606611 RepID=UPI0012DDEC19|nr:hypothetical protein [Mycolicibacterium sp. CBMA 226]MUL78795.1 hypothetical protein [Mycolicibacterium sp. CBMA 226]QGW61088.1 hypothetical protein ICEMyc226_00056 [Mycolicibacterium sp.]
MIARTTFTAAAVILLAAGCGNSASSGTSTGPTTKPDLSAVTESLLVSQSSFPVIGGATWHTGVVPQSSRRFTYDPAEVVVGPAVATNPVDCGQLLGSPSQSNFASATLTLKGERSVSVTIYQPQQRPDFARIIAECGSYQDPSLNRLVVCTTASTATTTVSTISVPDLPEWATAFQTKTDACRFAGEGHALENRPMYRSRIVGIYRGIMIRVIYAENSADQPEQHPDIVKSLGKLFAAQAAKLADA